MNEFNCLNSQFPIYPLNSQEEVISCLKDLDSRINSSVRCSFQELERAYTSLIEHSIQKFQDLNQNTEFQSLNASILLTLHKIKTGNCIKFMTSPISFVNIFKKGFYVPLENNAPGAKYFPQDCRTEDFSYAAYVDSERIGTPFSSMPGNQEYQIYQLSDHGKTLNVNLQRWGHKAIQATLRLKEYFPNEKLVYQGLYKSPKTNVERTFTMTFKKAGENGILGYAKTGHNKHGQFLLKRIMSHNESYQMFAKMGAQEVGSWITKKFKSLCGQRPKRDPKQD